MKLVFAILLTLSVALVSVDEASGQTFQYSRGWTNGRKRSQEIPMATELLARKLFPFANWPVLVNRLNDPVSAPALPFTNNCQYLKSCSDNDDRTNVERTVSRNFELPLLNNEFDHRVVD